MTAKKRLKREFRTIEAMTRLYCKKNCGADAVPCEKCRSFLEYAKERLTKCPFQEAKPTCAKCPIHCYKPEMKEKARTIMKFAGPKMPCRHPVLALFHLLDGRRSPPDLHRRKD